MKAKNVIFLIDGSSFLYRSFYGLRALHTSNGVPINAVYGFCRMIKKLIDKFNPTEMALIWDSKGKTFRHEIYSEYKATRQAPPLELFDQKRLIDEFSGMIGLKDISMPGVEADDILYSLAKDFEFKGYRVIAVTSDKDMCQMLSPKIWIYDSFKDLMMDEASYFREKGLDSKKIPFYFSLLGDVSDNIPGVKGIGKKTALELVSGFKNLNELYDNIETISRDRTKALLLSGKEKAFLSEKLFLLRYVKLDYKEEDFKFSVNNWIKAKNFFEKYEFKSLLKGLSSLEQKVSLDSLKLSKVKGYEFKTVSTEKELKDLCLLLNRKKLFSIDTETTGIDPLRDKCVGISICAEEKLAYYIPFGHAEGRQLSKKMVFKYLSSIFENRDIKKILHNAKFDKLVLWKEGINIKGVLCDTLLAARLVVEDWQRIGLKYLSIYYLNEKSLSFSDVIKHGNYKDFSFVPIDLATEYSGADALQTFRLYFIMREELKKKNMLKLYEDLEHPLIDVLFKIELNGISVDTKVLSDLSNRITVKLSQIKKEILDLAGRDINLNSPKQIESLLFDYLGLPKQKKSVKKTGYSTDQGVLELLSDLHPAPKLILNYRELFKLKSAYVDSLPNFINPRTGRVHTSFSQTIVSTGRLSSSEPNLQNIPSGEIRAAFKPSENFLFLSADYSQIELRTLAYLSQDKNLVNAFLMNRDIHVETASRLFNVELDKVTNKQRQVGKRINFSIIYGLTPFGLSKDLKISFKEAKNYIEKYFKQYPSISAWMEKIIEGAKKLGYVQTYWGRRRYITGIQENNKTLYEAAKRMAINSVTQGTAAEIMKLGMIRLDSVLKKNNLDARIILQIHDELLIECPIEQTQETEKITKEVLEGVVDWNVPLIVSTKLGENWRQVSK